MNEVKIFLDNNSTTQIDPRVLNAMIEEFEKGPSNPSSTHSFGQEARQRLISARELIASYLSVRNDELIFTSSGTEALNLAILSNTGSGRIITSNIEHAAVYHTVKRLERPCVFLPMGKEGHVHVKNVEEAVEAGAKLIILSAVNSETGVKNPIEEIASIAEKYRIPFIVDAVAWLGKEQIVIPKGVSAMAFSSHKIHGPLGVGLLFARKDFPIFPLVTGGGQELMRRSGTENLPGIVGFAKAISLLQEELLPSMKQITYLRDLLENSLEDVVINGTGPRVCNTSSITFPGCDGEALLIHLDMQKIAVSMGSACSSGSIEPSRVLQNMGLSRDEALSTLRFSLSRFTTEEEIRKTIDILKHVKIVIPEKI